MTRRLDPPAEHQRATRLLRLESPVELPEVDADTLMLCESGFQPYKHKATCELPEPLDPGDLPHHMEIQYICGPCAERLGISLVGARVLRS